MQIWARLCGAALVVRWNRLVVGNCFPAISANDEDASFFSPFFTFIWCVGGRSPSRFVPLMTGSHASGPFLDFGRVTTICGNDCLWVRFVVGTLRGFISARLW